MEQQIKQTINQQPDKEPTVEEKPCCHSKVFWSVLIAVVVTAIIVGGGCYLWFEVLSQDQTTNANVNQTTAITANVNKNANISNVNGKVVVNGNANANTNANVVISNTNSSATAGWQTYTNTEDNYSIKYPITWTVSMVSSPTIQILPPDSASKTTIELCPGIFIKVVEEIKDDEFVHDKTTVTINDLQATQQRESGMADFLVTYFPSDNKYVKINWPIVFADSYPEYEEILKTFKLLESVKNEDKRETLIPKGSDSYGSGFNDSTHTCEEAGFNHDQFNQWIDYISSARGIQFKLPYNKNWGNNNYHLNPYDEVGDELLFGSLGPFEACTLMRSYNLTFLPVKNSQQVINDLEDTNGYPDLFSLKPVVEIINSLEVVKYNEGGLCAYPTMIIIGKKYNYRLRPLCGGCEDCEFNFFREIINTMQLI